MIFFALQKVSNLRVPHVVSLYAGENDKTLLQIERAPASNAQQIDCDGVVVDCDPVSKEEQSNVFVKYKEVGIHF